MSPDLTCDLDRAVAHIFRVMLALDCTPVQYHEAAQPVGPGLSATVRFSSGVAGWFALAVMPEAAQELAGALTGLPHEDLSQALASDTVAELCNVIAGNWKSRCPPPVSTCSLSPPTLASRGPECGSPTLTRLYSFASHEFTLQVSLC